MNELKEPILHYEKHFCGDDKDWILFIHGAGGSIQTWNRQVAAFKGKYNLLVIDLRDHGNSKKVSAYHKIRYTFELVAQDVIELVDYLKIPKAHYMGVSVGTVIIRKIEELRPDLFLSILFSGGMFRVTPKISFLLRSGLLLSNVLPYQAVYRLFAYILMPKKNHVTSRKIFIRESIKIKQHEFNKWMVLCKDVNKVLKSYFNKPMSVPSLVVMGEQDHVFLKPAKEYAALHPKNTHLKIVKKCGHVCNIEQAHYFNQLCLTFLQENFQKEPQ